jgi:uncharacterized protein (UPF0332 family)
MTDANRAANAAAERKAAIEALAEARALDRLSHYGGAISRAYYAAFHAARALLVEKGLQPKTHDGVRRLVTAGNLLYPFIR